MTLFFVEKSSHLIGLFFWMFGSFLIGYVFSWFYHKKKYETQIEESNETITELRTEMKSTIRARKTVERGGIEIKHPKELSFDNIGSANENNRDDLTKINGIGSFIEKKLNNIGIYNYLQISKLSKEEIETLTDLIQFFPGRIERDDWTGQAKQLLEDKTV